MTNIHTILQIILESLRNNEDMILCFGYLYSL